MQNELSEKENIYIGFEKNFESINFTFLIASILVYKKYIRSLHVLAVV